MTERSKTNPIPVVHTAAAYIRVSTDDQIELSPASQLVEIRKWADSHGFWVPDEYVFTDEGISGRKVTGRDEFRRMIGVAKSKPKPFDAILLWKFSRFARNRDDAVMYKSILRKQLGIDVISISEPMAEGKMGIITEALIEAMDEYYSINLAEEVKRGMEEKHRRGELQSVPSYGYSVKDGVLVPNPPEDEYIKEIFRRFLAGDGPYTISNWMNESGQRTHRGNRFENRTIEYILQNPVYIGKLRWNPVRHTGRNFSDENIIVQDGKHQPIIDTQTFEAAQRRIAEKKALHKYKEKPAEVQKHWLSGLVRCASCGKTLIFQKPYYWKCNGYLHGACRTSQHVVSPLLEDAIMDRLRLDAAAGSELSFDIINTADNHNNNLQTLLRAKESALKMLDRLRDAYLSGADTVDEYKSGKNALMLRISEIDKQISSEENKASPEEAADALCRSIRTALKTLSSPTASTAEKYSAAHSIIDRAVWDKSQNLLQIHYRLVF